MVYSPPHYRKEGRKECIEEMIEVFGIEDVMTFCKLNIYKYNYRHDLKDGDRDLKKAENYEDIYVKLCLMEDEVK